MHQIIMNVLELIKLKWNDIIKSIASSLPFGLTKTKKENVTSSNATYIGALLSMDGIADTARDNVWDKSGMELIVHIRESKEETAFYLFTRLSDDNDDYLLAATDNEIITTSQTRYGFDVSSIMKAK